MSRAERKRKAAQASIARTVAEVRAFLAGGRSVVMPPIKAAKDAS